MGLLTVTLPDRSARSLPEGSTAADLAADIGPGLARAALIAVVDGEPTDLDRPLSDGAEVAIVTDRDDLGLETIRHSTAHVMAQAILDLHPGATFAIGPPIEHGFYYDFDLPEGRTLTTDDLAAIEDRMREIIAADQDFERHELSLADAREFFAGEPYKLEIINAAGDGAVAADDSRELTGDTVSYYRNGDSFVDMCRGPHVPSTGRLGHFKLQKVAGAYWRGDEKRPMLQRIYGTAWASKKDLKAHLVRLEEAEKRDHRRLASELDLVSWPEELGPGLAVWHAKGATIRTLMEDYSRHRHATGGYEFAYSPHIAKAVLWETSGHLDFYADSMYPPMELEDQDGAGATYYPKPMNCPFHVMIYKSDQRSYRELPKRIFELGTVYRYELSGAVHGLMRSRGFTQDDSHIFCTRDQVAGELESLLDFVLSVLRAFGFSEFQARLSTKPEEKCVGDDEIWESATAGLEAALKAHGLEYALDEGGGAFYGPKIDIDVRDAIGRAWQLSTIQLDFNLPERFELEYVGPDGGRHRPVMIHRALMGSIERFFGVLIEHYAGAFPAWLAPVQARILPVAAAHETYAQHVFEELRAAGFRAELDAADDPLGKRVRNGKVAKIPYVLVVGDADVAHTTVGVNARGVDEVDRDVPLADFIERLRADVDART